MLLSPDLHFGAQEEADTANCAQHTVTASPGLATIPETGDSSPAASRSISLSLPLPAPAPAPVQATAAATTLAPQTSARLHGAAHDPVAEQQAAGASASAQLPSSDAQQQHHVARVLANARARIDSQAGEGGSRSPGHGAPLQRDLMFGAPAQLQADASGAGSVANAGQPASQEAAASASINPVSAQEYDGLSAMLQAVLRDGAEAQEREQRPRRAQSLTHSGNIPVPNPTLDRTSTPLQRLSLARLSAHLRGSNDMPARHPPVVGPTLQQRMSHPRLEARGIAAQQVQHHRRGDYGACKCCSGASHSCTDACNTRCCGVPIKYAACSTGLCCFWAFMCLT